MREIIINTKSRTELIDITRQVAAVVRESNISEGHCLIYCPHTTAGLLINEHADPDVAADINAQLTRMVPYGFNYKHTEGNADAHIKAALIGNSLYLIVQNSSLLLGTWQGIFFCEFDGPRQRRVWISVK